MVWLSVVVVVCLSSHASSTELAGAPDDNMAKTFGVLTAEVRDSFLYPVLLNPLSINKLTCGSVLTLYDNSDSDITVAADICLITLLIGKLMVLFPIILENLNVQTNYLDMFTKTAALYTVQLYKTAALYNSIFK